MAATQRLADRVEALVEEAAAVSTALYLDHAKLADEATRPEALKRGEISGIRKYVQKHCTETLDTEALEKVSGAAMGVRRLASGLWRRLRHPCHANLAGARS